MGPEVRVAFREVTVSEVREVLRVMAPGHGLREIARLMGINRETVPTAVGCVPAAPDSASRHLLG